MTFSVRLGLFTVTSGTVWTGDPCYILGADSSHGPKDRAGLDTALAPLTGTDPALSLEAFGTGAGIALRTTNGIAAVWGEPHAGNGRGFSQVEVRLPGNRIPTVTGKRIGNAGVDSGLIWFGDPSLTMGIDAAHTPQGWGDFCRLLWNTETNSHDSDGYSSPLGPEAGVVTQTLYGDGNYPITADFDDEGFVTRLAITFENPDLDLDRWDEDEDEDEDEDDEVAT